MEEEKKLEIVAGDGSNLDISPVYEHLQDSKPQSADKKPTNIVIPKERKSNSKKNKPKKEEKQNN